MSRAEELNRQLKRDRRIRREMLMVIVGERANKHAGWLTAQYVVEILAESLSNGIVPDDERHAKLLLVDLVSGGYAEERDDRSEETEPFRLDTWSVRSTNKGSALISRAIEPDPMIADPRPRDTTPRK